jgi:hypothetical protein
VLFELRRTEHRGIGRRSSALPDFICRATWAGTVRHDPPLPAATLAAIILAADGLTYTARIDGEDLFATVLELLNAGMIAD